MLLVALTNLIYKLLAIIIVIGIVSTTIYYFILKFTYKNKRNSNGNFKGRNIKRNKVNSKNHYDDKENKVLRVIELDEEPKDIVIVETEEIKHLRKQASELISSSVKAGKLKRKDILSLMQFITRITSKKKSRRHKNDLHFIYSSIKHYEISQQNLLKIIYFVEKRLKISEE